MTPPPGAVAAGRTDSRMLLTVIGGFLGSGKTTLLDRAYRDPDTVVIVNDAGERAPDLAADVLTLLGGCACCDRLDALVALLRDLCERRHSRTGPNRVVLETSGLADPARILQAVDRDRVLVSNVTVVDVVVTVDAARGVSDLIHEPLAREQVEQADTVIVTKADLVDDHGLGVVLATVAAMNPGAVLEVSAFGRPPPIPAFHPADAVPLPAATTQSTPRSAWIPVSGTVDWTVFSLWLSALVVAYPHQILRLKGLLRTPRGPVILHAARGTIGLPTVLDAAADDDEDHGLLFVVRDLDPATVRASWDAHRRALSAES
ncbi:CobW family GTP-binding protein [Gordonia hydrophobica]|uniref:GTP-binding protein n=1 Tax=Gordonia hydrophobica TaxID=40516 RepID=A0ABZ2U706_9ACTN|nr:GTP-binding protein [Gordonia hydrophobica]MBM7368258.1 G3E family GTPase [Gordonia hydrophobica]